MIKKDKWLTFKGVLMILGIIISLTIIGYILVNVILFIIVSISLNSM